MSQSVSVNRHLPILDFGKTTGRVFYCSFNPLRTFRTGPNSKNLALACGFPKRPWVPPSLQIRIVPANRVPTLTCNCLCMYPAQNNLEKNNQKKYPTSPNPKIPSKFVTHPYNPAPIFLISRNCPLTQKSLFPNFISRKDFLNYLSRFS